MMMMEKKLFWHSSAHVLAEDIFRFYPKQVGTIGPAY
jgi:threonyl-tRNA synthetase